MASPYQKLVRRAEDKKKAPKPNAYQIHKISFEDSDDSSRIDIPNVFLQDREDPPSPPKRRRQDKEEVLSLHKTESEQHFELGGRLAHLSPPNRKLSDSQLQAQAEPEDQQVLGQTQVQPNSSLSLLEIVKLNLGELLFRNCYPLHKTIYINNNNDYENELNMKGHLIKGGEKEILHFSNSLKVTRALFFTALLFRNLCAELYIYAWAAVLLLQLFAERLLFQKDIQYGTDKTSMLVLLVAAIAMQVLCDTLSYRRRNKWQDNNQLCRIYHNNGQLGQWVNTRASQIKAGNLFKLSKGEVFPADCVLLYSEHSLLQINERAVVTQLVEHPSEVVLKETAVKGDIVLPISGSITYEISNPEYSEFQVLGKLNLQEPAKVSHGVGMDNIVLRGSCNASEVEVICLALQTGIDSFFLKSLQYPLLLRKSWEYSREAKSRRISNEVKQEIKDYQSRLQGCNLEKKVESAIWFMLLFYFLLVGVGVLVRFALSLGSTPFYLSSSGIPIWYVLIYHLTNNLILIPVLLLPTFKLLVVLSGALAERNLSQRAIALVPADDPHRRSNSFADGNHDELLDNHKIVFPITIKDYNLLPEINKVDTIITTIDTFRDHSAFTLHSIRVKQVGHNFMTGNIDSESMSTQDVKTMKYFMQVALLTTTKSDSPERLSKSYDSGIEQAARKHFNLKKNKNAMGETTVGDFLVRELFHIHPVYQYPYKVVFLEAVKEEQAEDDLRVLVLIRGHPKTILDKCYGKEVKYTLESRQLQDKKGFHVELVAKLTLHVTDAAEIQKAYSSNTHDKKSFYKNLDKYISKVESMGLLVFVNQFHQRKISDSPKNPVLNKSILNFSQVPKHQGSCDLISSQMMPNMIILAPASKSPEPVFESIHTITNLLINPYIFHLGISEVGSKILHEKPTDLDSMFAQLEEEKVLVWNGWDQKDILYTVDVMKKYGRNILFYYQKDEFMYLSKQAQFSIAGNSQGYDCEKYSDVNLSCRSSISYLYLLQLIKYDSTVVRQAALSWLLTQLGKYALYFVVELVNVFLTKGTGLMVIKSPLFLVVEVVLFFDVFYYLNWDDSVRAYSFARGDTYFKVVAWTLFQKVLQGLFLTLVCCYSMQTPSAANGAPHPYQYSYFLIVLVIVHVLVLQKILNALTQSFSLYKALIIAVQLLLAYLGFIAVSVIDKYFYYGILWNALSAGNLVVTAIGCVWVCLTLPALRVLRQLMKTRNLKLKTGKRDN